MVRKRFAFLAALLGLGLVGGCTSSNCCGERPSFWDRFRRHPECCPETGAPPATVTEGPVIENDAVVVPPATTSSPSCATPGPQGTISPPLMEAPRLQPQAQPRAFVPK